MGCPSRYTTKCGNATLLSTGALCAALAGSTKKRHLGGQRRDVDEAFSKGVLARVVQSKQIHWFSNTQSSTPPSPHTGRSEMAI
eukprot:COSAG04_NODE_8082_length_1025_cov_1.919006_2_plen_83_part_01